MGESREKNSGQIIHFYKMFTDYIWYEFQIVALVFWAESV